MQAIKSNESFKSVINSDTPVIVKFEAGWCHCSCYGFMD